MCDKIEKALLEYCAQDTMALVRLLEKRRGSNTKSDVGSKSTDIYHIENPENDYHHFLTRLNNRSTRDFGGMK
jgi:hypothetical protein